MKKLGMKKNRWENLDLLTIFIKESNQEFVISINSVFFSHPTTYAFQKNEKIYNTSSTLDEIWKLISQKKYKQAEKLLKTLESNTTNRDIIYTNFIISLFLEKDAFPYLKACVENLEEENSEYYRIYLELYGTIDSELDIPSLLDLLPPEKKIVAISSKSYNGNYLEFISAIRESDFKKAKRKIAICRKMKPDLFHLEVIEQLLKMASKSSEELQKKKKQQEKELEKQRCEKFVSLIKEKKYLEAKEQVEIILSYRNLNHKNNYVYHLFLEALEMMLTFQKDITFEIPVVSYTYKKESDFLYTFLEAITVGDFKTALEVGKKCCNKAIDSSEPKLKVGTYLIILEDLLKGVSSREIKEENLYQIVQNNIQRGHFIHALELYQNNQIVLSNYQAKLIMDLFQSGIKIEKKEIPFQELYHGEKKVEQITIADIFPVEEKKETSDSTILEEKKDEDTSNKKEKQKTSSENVGDDVKEEIVYPVEPIIKHTEPTHEYFIYYTKCLEFGQYEEARYWLSQFGGLLKANHIQKRVDHYYYAIETSYAESLDEKSFIAKKEELYTLAYNAIQNYDYEKAITYLDYYQKMDTCRNNKALILKGYAYRKMGKYESAMKCLIQANSISPNPDAYYFLGDIYYKLHKFKDAVFCYITYNEFYPKENLTVYLNLSESYRKLNNSTKALKYLKIADEINTNQGRGLNLKNRILRAEMTNHKREKFRLEKNENVE